MHLSFVPRFFFINCSSESCINCLIIIIVSLYNHLGWLITVGNQNEYKNVHEWIMNLDESVKSTICSTLESWQLRSQMSTLCRCPDCSPLFLFSTWHNHRSPWLTPSLHPVHRTVAVESTVITWYPLPIVVKTEAGLPWNKKVDSVANQWVKT